MMAAILIDVLRVDIVGYRVRLVFRSGVFENQESQPLIVRAERVRGKSLQRRSCV